MCISILLSIYERSARARVLFRIYLSLSLSLCVSRIITLVCLVFHARTTNLVVKDSRCRGGIVNILGGCSRALTVRWLHPKAL